MPSNVDVGSPGAVKKRGDDIRNAKVSALNGLAVVLADKAATRYLASIVRACEPFATMPVGVGSDALGRCIARREIGLGVVSDILVCAGAAGLDDFLQAMKGEDTDE